MGKWMSLKDAQNIFEGRCELYSKKKNQYDNFFIGFICGSATVFFIIQLIYLIV